MTKIIISATGIRRLSIFIRLQLLHVKITDIPQ